MPVRRRQSRSAVGVARVADRPNDGPKPHDVVNRGRDNRRPVLHSCYRPTRVSHARLWSMVTYYAARKETPGKRGSRVAAVDFQRRHGPVVLLWWNPSHREMQHVGTRVRDRVSVMEPHP